MSVSTQVAIGDLVRPVSNRIPVDNDEEQLIHSVYRHQLCVILEVKELIGKPFKRIHVLCTNGITGWTFSDYLEVIQ